MLADISDYMICLVLDALTDHVLAKKLLMLFLKLKAWLTEVSYAETSAGNHEHENIEYYIGFLYGLERILSLWHLIQILPFGEAFSRDDLMRRWKITSSKLGLKA